MAAVFLHAPDDASGPLLIPQAAHAWMAWQVASHWGNRRAAAPAPRPEMLAAVLLHDSGWTEFDRAPIVDDDGRPVTFDRMPPSEHLAIWTACVDRAEQHSRYAALLVASHFARMAAHKDSDLGERGLERPREGVQAFREAMDGRIAAWRSELVRDPRYRAFLDGNGWRTNTLLLAACDRISVFLCADLGERFAAEVLDGDGQTLRVTFTGEGSRRFRVRPWPLEGSRVALHCEGWRLPRARFADDTELRTALAEAPRERLRFELLRPSAAG